MAQYGDRYGRNQIDEYGNPIRQTDEYGNPIHHTTGAGGDTIGTGGDTMGEYGMYSSGTGTGAFSGPYAVGTGEQHYGLSSMLQRSGSSSSSEDDGLGGRRRKKGLKEKVKEKLPGSHTGDKSHYTASTATPTTTPVFGYGHEGHHEKKGIMEKIKEKLPGTHHQH